ncbi:PREDICTED: zinc finger Y-chromosomal protein 1 [Dinoponera quadriceps]|uniref:Zinc finger Y-chromosomal protein 1 n=1 Tax=Dinoponera quadriceps TaxID=609295 RepID=A0A6P3XD22_DINQU|nr:PREDICTED: zinc finger Y-chromosomal protein 1 [Dinoponera quadriceps]XP_014476237.1 PREDICTED: zinc finger Y-chromosomal protein 1 [Dinoponera quadriceps]XP_014476238.1 PREDICTED: zinc finger Y-chromosomal protein 1 [Dinoponera quadriceps]XP_014476239.1 PREDICTED: zinc finger Y-chromosomal protein 1 [Dinoponera quadriceps]XP_014476240.1 PREDICTED: zinc finger Y-chromosomal protein 1 [Dinoponera quadriceps]
MDIPSEILETLDIVGGKNVMEVLKDGVSEQDIILESEVTEDVEETEIEEIIEIIEEIEECDEIPADDDVSLSKDKTSSMKKNGIVVKEMNEIHKEANDKNTEIYGFDEENSMFISPSVTEEVIKNNSTQNSSNKKQVIKYDVDEDWQDEDLERMEELDNTEIQAQVISKSDKKHVNNQSVTMSLQSNRLDIRTHMDSMAKSDKLKMDSGIGSNVNNIEDNSSTHEIVKNVENNLLYTVLGTKKQDSSMKQQEKLSDAQYIKMERLDENTIPVEGTIYYEGDNMETLYVAQAVDDNEQYQYDNAAIEQDEQIWETSNNESNQNQEEDNSQDQIFLHEDEDGQLYFKDDNGALQPVYLTDDGNYAIAENNDDQVTSKELQSKSEQNNKTIEDDSFILPDLDTKSSNKQMSNTAIAASPLLDIDNDDTVTISLIISEDENGQKRTQVIIPTTDNLKCDICNKSFKTSFQLLRHNRLKHAREEDITTRNFPCDLCPKRYPDQTSLARHRKTHTGDRPFQCLECHKNFPTSTALRRHLNLHNSQPSAAVLQQRPLPCIYCGRRFMEKASLTKHEESHMPSEQRVHTCDICQKSFSHVTDLSMHKKYHDPDKKFDCEVCGREFNRLNNLQRHMMVHQQQQGENEEILSCDVCGITYKFMSSLTRHMVTTHMNPEKLRQQAEEQRRKRENNYRKYLENRKMYETQHTTYNTKRNYHNARILTGNNDDTA